jgi:hypothetical protein
MAFDINGTNRRGEHLPQQSPTNFFASYDYINSGLNLSLRGSETREDLKTPLLDNQVFHARLIV